jgi:bile acid-coenzyme A ligase
VPHHTLGSVVGAHVVLQRGASVRKAELAAHCARRLAGYKIPKHFTFVDQVPRSPADKIQRWRLAPHHENGATPP